MVLSRSRSKPMQEADRSTIADLPTTCPDVSIALAEARLPPSVPRSSVAGLMGLLGAVRKAARVKVWWAVGLPDHLARVVDTRGEAGRADQNPEVIGGWWPH